MQDGKPTDGWTGIRFGFAELFKERLVDLSFCTLSNSDSRVTPIHTVGRPVFEIDLGIPVWTDDFESDRWLATAQSIAYELV